MVFKITAIMEQEHDNRYFLPLLLERRKKLDQKSLDWEAWKKGTVMVIKGAFGENSYLVKQLEELEYEYSSWSLRDTSGSGDPVKSSALEILDLCIALINNPVNAPSPVKPETSSIVKNYLSQDAINEIKEVALSGEPIFTIEEKILKILSTQEPAALTRLLANLLAEHYKTG